METISRQSWEFVIRELLRAYKGKWGPFSEASLYREDIDPWENDALNAKIDLERAAGNGYKAPEDIVEFLHICEEGWFFEEKAAFYELLREYSAQRGAVSGTIPGRDAQS